MKTKTILLAVLTVVSLWSGAGGARAATLVSEWKFEDNLNDTSGNGNHGTATGGPAFAAGRFGRGISLARADMIQNTAATGLPMAGNASWSMNLWVNLSAEPESLAYIGGFGPVLSPGTGAARGFLALSGAGRNINIWGGGPDLATPQAYPTGSWAMLTVTHNGADNMTTVYLDGTSIASGAQALADIPGAENKISLAPVSNWGKDLDASFDEFSIWDGVLAPAQIADLFAGGNGLVPQKVVEWKFENNLNDTSGFENHGTATGGPTYVEGRFGQAVSLVRADMIENTAARFLPMAGNASWSMNLWVNLPAEPELLAYLGGFGPVGDGAGAGTARGFLAFTGPANRNYYIWGNSVDLATPQAYPTFRWAMLTVTHNGADNITTAYLDADMVASGAQALAAIPGAENKVSLAPVSLWGKDLDGSFDEFTVWNGVLSLSEIRLLFGLGPDLVITRQPQDMTRYAGEAGAFSMQGAGGTGELSYQWRKDGTDLPDATNALLTFSSLAASNAGTYSVVMRDTGGSSVTSAPAVLVVVAAGTDISTALVGYWNFDEGAGSLLVDNSGNGNDGTLMNFLTDDTQWVPGQVGGALNFRGPSGGDYVVVPNYPRPSSTMTIAAWVWADARPTWATIAKNWTNEATAQFHFGLQDAAGDLSNYLIQQGGTRVGPVQEGAALPLGSWQHVALVCDGLNMRLYRNGGQVGAPLAYNGTINTNPVAQALGIGAKLGPNGVPVADVSSGYWQGKMDDLGLWARALSPNEILAVFVAGLNGVPLTEAVVGAFPPAIGTPPQSLTVTEGDGALFSVVASGTPPLSYQWRKNGTDLADATNSTLALSNLCAADGGDFTVVICNVADCVTSAPPATLTVLPLTGAVPITEGLVGHWAFDETTGTNALDSTLGASRGNLNNFPADNSQWVPGQIGGALNFRGPGAGDYVVVPDYPKPASNLTISAWVWAEARPTWASIVKNWATQAGGEIHFGLNNVEGDLSNYLIQQDGVDVGPVREGIIAPLPLGSWQHVALVCDGSKQQIFRNGVPVGAPLAYNGTINTNLSIPMLAIGAKLGSDGVPVADVSSGYWQGKMDDIGLWQRGLSVAEIQAVYSAGLEGRALTSASVLPKLQIARTGGNVVLSWPANPAGNCFVLKWSATLPATSWTPVGQTPVFSGGRFSVTISGPEDARFYRLEK